MSERDAIVVGLGVGGEHVAGTLAEAGMDVLGIEQTLVGGECPYWGCIPTKMMVRAANAVAETKRAHGLAGDARVHPDYSPVSKRIRGRRPMTGTTKSRLSASRARAGPSSEARRVSSAPGRSKSMVRDTRHGER